MRAEGRALADRLRREAIDLAMSKATEFSPKISLYFLLAAKAALLAYWPEGRDLDLFEKDIRYYQIFESSQKLVEEYESFREAYTGDRGS